MTQTTPLYAKINGIRIAYQTQGTGFPLVMLHGFPRTRRTWEKLAGALSQRYMLITPDRRGYGDTDRPTDATTFATSMIASDHVQLLDHLGVRECVVLGHDKGAAPARRIAVENPDRVRGLIILDGAAEGANIERRRDTSGRQWYMDFFRQRGVAEQLIGQNPRLFFSLFLERNPHLTPEEHEYYTSMFSRRGTVDAILADYRSGELEPNYWQEVMASGQKMPTPVLALWGGRGPSAGTPILDSWRQVAVNVRGEQIEDAAHYVHEEQPELVAKHILAFADELRL